jgi:hypothetical protein
MRQYRVNLDAILSRVQRESARSAMRSGIASEISQREAIRKGIKFDQPTSVKNHEVKQPNHYYVFCSHEVPYWRTCGKCGRDKSLASRNADLVLRSIGGAAFFTK